MKGSVAFMEGILATQTSSSIILSAAAHGGISAHRKARAAVAKLMKRVHAISLVTSSFCGDRNNLSPLTGTVI